MLYSDARDMINMPSEILSVGGPSSVRAYRPGESSGYQGYFLTGELRTDLANWEEVSLPDFMPSAQTYFFVDHMLAQSQYRQRSRADYWSGYGVGLQIPSIFNLLTFDIYWSEALDGAVHEEEKEFYDDELFQFSLSARFRLQ
jgi:hemolysin activation/secretion protein